MHWRTPLIAGLILAIAATTVAFGGPAQDVLRDLAESERSARRTIGFVLVGVGAAVGIGSAVILAESGLAEYGLIAGGLVALPGIVTLAIPSAAEREYARAGSSETESALALERLADGGRRDRYISGLFNLAAGVASLLYPYQYVTSFDYVYSALTSFGMAAYDLLIPSKEEEAFRRYQRLAGEGG